jgi:cytochrome c biogenesis protein CcdA
VTSIIGAFVTGFIISILLLPCTSGPYIVIIGMLGKTSYKIQAIWLLLLYNFIFILPFVLITLAVGLGVSTTARIELWRQNNRQKFNLFTGIFLLILGTALLITTFF